MRYGRDANKELLKLAAVVSDTMIIGSDSDASGNSV